MTPYLNEMRVNWRPLAAAFLGLSGGLMMASYVMGIMAPYLIEEFGWPRSQFALVSGLGLVSVLAFPVVGRLTDIVGVRVAALFGLVASPLLFFALSQLYDLRTYAILFALQCFLLVTTTPPVYCRVVVQYAKRARGLSLALVMSGPAITVAIGGPLLNDFVAANGWRAGYLALVGFTVVSGLLTFMLLPAHTKAQPKQIKRKTAKEDYARIFRTPAFWILFVAVLLTTLPQSMMMTQLSLVLAENGAVGTDASAIISLYATGMLLGRFVAGVALDRFSAPLVSAIGLSLSAIGLFLFASDLDARPVLMIAALLFGLTCGAEGDVVAYLIVRNFGVRIYSTVAGITAATVAISAVLGAILLSVLLKVFANFTPFLIVAGVLVLIGSGLFLLLPSNPILDPEDEHDESASPSAIEADEGSAPAKAPA